MALLQLPRHVAADLLDLIGDVAAAVVITGLAAASRVLGGPPSDGQVRLVAVSGPSPSGPALSGELARAAGGAPGLVPAVDSTGVAREDDPVAGSGEVLDKAFAGVLDLASLALGGLVRGCATVTAGLVVAVCWPVEGPTQAVARDDLACHPRRHLEPVASRAIDNLRPGQEAGLRVTRESGG
jgi:hypothetical protein